MSEQIFALLNKNSHLKTFRTRNSKITTQATLPLGINTFFFTPLRMRSYTFPSGLLFSTQISSVEGMEGAGAGEAVGGIPGGKIMPGGGGMDPPGGGINGGLLK